jgi:two-component system response regulator ChvI
MEPIRVLFVEDDPDYREALAGDLSDHGFSVRSFPDGASLLGSPDAAADADVIVLDWALPEISGLDLLSLLRQRGVDLPVVFLTGYGYVDYESEAFAQGAIDFIDKARGAEIVVRRLKLVAEPREAREAKAARRPVERPVLERQALGRLVLAPAMSRAYWGGADVGLTRTEYDVVDLLVSGAGQYLTYRSIYDRMYYEGFQAGQGKQGYRTNVRSLIKRIRRKFCDLDRSFDRIENSIALGYRWRLPDDRPSPGLLGFDLKERR